MSYLYASSSAAYASTSALREDRENADPSTSMEGKTAIKNQQQFCIGGGSSNSTDDHDYIRTAIVTNANDEFMNSVSLCLICGSVGKDAEATMLTCTSCAQSYHTFCVGMQDKVWANMSYRGVGNLYSYFFKFNHLNLKQTLTMKCEILFYSRFIHFFLAKFYDTEARLAMSGLYCL